MLKADKNGKTKYEQTHKNSIQTLIWNHITCRKPFLQYFANITGTSN